VPKVGIGPIRREQICRAAASVIAREGLAGSTMRMVAAEAGVSTGMLNHYFANREDLLTQSLMFVSERHQKRLRAAIDGVPAGQGRLTALLDSAIAPAEEVTETWLVWINVFGEAIRLPELRHAVDLRTRSWYGLIDTALEGMVSAEEPGSIPWSWRLDAALTGLMIRVLTTGAELDRRQIRDEVVRMLFATAPAARTRKRPRRVAL
jgi:TetR/AcrR family transcriptional regulator, transcriptional repressor of bet genes